MGRYLAFSWPVNDEANSQAQRWREGLAASPHWGVAWRSPGLEIWTERDRRMPVHRLGQNGAVVIGDCFNRRVGGRAQVVAPPQDPRAAARRLAGDTWGAYLALLPDHGGGAPWVFREPSAGLEALTWRAGALTAVADDIRHLPPGLVPSNLALDWDVITELVRRPLAAAHLSPLSGLRVIAPGDLQPMGEAPHRAVAVWRPSRWGAASAQIEADDATLRETVRACVSALAAVETTLLVEVSGGLDSAIVASALVDTGHRPRIAAALNYHGQRPEGDERPWAQALADYLDLPLLPIAKTIGEITGRDLAELAPCAAPAFMGIDAARDRDAAQRVADFGATATFGGQGGDAVFFQMPTAVVAADFLAAKGWGAWSDPWVSDVARWLRRPVWSILRQARQARDGLTAAAPDSSPFWGARARQATGAPTHPWLADLPALSPAKQVQTQALMGMQAAWHRSRRGGAARIVHPLLSQPIVELALSIPVWRLLGGGRDRALARTAFAPWLPPVVTGRQSKGALTSDYTKRAAASLPFLREHLVGGVLAEAGVLDAAAVDAALDPDQLIWNGAGARLSQAALIESWVRHWQTRVPDHPAARR